MVRNNNLGLVLHTMGRYGEAIDSLGAKLAAHKKDGNVMGILFSSIVLADSYRLKRNCEAAIAVAKSALELAKSTGQNAWIMRAHDAISNIYHDTDNFEKALDEDDKCSACQAFLLDGSEKKRLAMSVWTRKGHCYKELKKNNKAIIHFQHVIDEQAEPVFLMSAHEGLGEVLFNMGEVDEGLEHLDIAQALLDQAIGGRDIAFTFPVMRLKVRILHKTGRDMEIEPLMDRLYDLSKGNPDWYSQYLDLKKEIEAEPSTVSHY